MSSEPGGAGVSQPAELSLALVLENSSREHIARVQSGAAGLAARPKPGVCVLELQRIVEWFGRDIKNRGQKMGGVRASDTGNPLPTTGLPTGPDSLSPVLPVLLTALLGSSSQDLLCQPLPLQIHCKAAPELTETSRSKTRPCNTAFAEILIGGAE